MLPLCPWWTSRPPWAGPGHYWLSGRGNGASIPLGQCDDPEDLTASLKVALDPRLSWRDWRVYRT